MLSGIDIIIGVTAIVAAVAAIAAVFWQQAVYRRQRHESLLITMLNIHIETVRNLDFQSPKNEKIKGSGDLAFLAMYRDFPLRRKSYKEYRAYHAGKLEPYFRKLERR